MGNIEGWFATPVYYADIATPEIKVELDAYLAANPFHNAFGFWADDVDTTWVKKKRTNTLMETCPTFRTAVEANIREYMANLDYSNAGLEITESWANQTAKGQYQNHHEHGAAHISGAYYHSSTGQKEQGELILKNPAPAAVVSQLMLQQIHTVHYPSLPGRLILFPSFLSHAVTVNQTDTPRISCSFNALITPAEG